jgi:hypothetical protein
LILIGLVISVFGNREVNHGSTKMKVKRREWKDWYYILILQKVQNVRCQKVQKMSGVLIQWKCMHTWFCFSLLVVYFNACAVIQSEFGEKKTLAEIICYKNTKSTILCLEFQTFPTDRGINTTYNYSA